MQIPAHGTMLRCPQCGNERSYARPPLLIVAGSSGAGKSTICARLAGKIPGAVLLDADVFTSDMVSLVTPVKDHPAFWRFLAKVAHEISQNNLVVVLFSVMLPGQLLANADVLDYFESVSFLCLTCDTDVLRQRLVRRVGAWTDIETIEAAVDRWSRFNDALVDAAGRTEDALMIDASRPVSEVEPDIRDWVLAKLENCPKRGTW